MVEHQEQIVAVVREAIRDWGQRSAVCERQGSARGGQGAQAAFVQMWSDLRRQLRSLSDTATSLAEDEQTALRLLYRLQTTSGTAVGEALAD